MLAIGHPLRHLWPLSSDAPLKQIQQVPSSWTPAAIEVQSSKDAK